MGKKSLKYIDNGNNDGSGNYMGLSHSAVIIPIIRLTNKEITFDWSSSSSETWQQGNVENSGTMTFKK